MTPTTLQVQKRLKALGFDPGPLDGIRGPLTDKAIVAFKKSINYKPRPLLGPLTLAALFDGAVATGQGAPADAPPWLRLAYGYMGLREIRGPDHNTAIVGWWEALKLPFRDDETPWCAGFANRMVQKAGFQIPDKYRAAALGWRWTGNGVRLPGPALGAIMDMERPGKPGSGHMTFVAGRTSKWMIAGLGGNQGNRVGVNPYSPTARDARYYYPTGYPLPEKTGMDTLPLVDAAGRTLSNEA
ncbi:TIGR02594 family protein [uncultured Roseobacter sp.]|uniref:NlpC/P60 family protein n=1 Tax=uncultured Roseobacter sp. TaxID=114847 RepID=UPI00260790E4|nr:TIGR02594 family protein [uncultured Roseobacter sp.]